MPAEIQFDPDVFHGELTVNRAQVFVRAERSAEFADCTLHGYVQGPRCEYAHTLPAKYALNDLGAGPTLLARATITDPCLWTSDLPQIYDVHIELRRGSDVVAREQRMLGLRGIGPRASGQMLREGKVWVPRGVAIELLNESIAATEKQSLVDQLREELLVGICTLPPLDLLAEASRRGAYLIVHLSAERPDLIAALRRLALWPAVMMVVLHGGENLERGLQQVAPNLIFAQACRTDFLEHFQPAPWAMVLVADAPGPRPTGPLPVIVQRLAAGPLSIGDARRACDQLQRELAATTQFAGYLVTSRVMCSEA